jgi:predicted metal-dependent hydrolase
LPLSAGLPGCSTAGNLNFNDELLKLDRDLGDYVIVHELLHFSAPNHGKLWKSRVLAHLGDHEDLAKRLQRMAGR